MYKPLQFVWFIVVNGDGKKANVFIGLLQGGGGGVPITNFCTIKTHL